MPFTISCSKCQKTLAVPDAAIGKKVRCPNCQEIVPVPAPPQSGAEAVTATPAPPTPAKSKPAAPAPWDKDNQDAIEEDAPPKKSKKKEDENVFAFTDDDEEEKRRPRKRRRRDDDDEDDDDDDDDVRRVRRGVPHRGATILTLGILSIFVACICPFIAWGLGGAAINMANTDLVQMSTGRMDSSGRSSTQAGKICGVIGVILGVINGIAGIILRVSMLKNR